jgi:hypothetical protein
VGTPNGPSHAARTVYIRITRQGSRRTHRRPFRIAKEGKFMSSVEVCAPAQGSLTQEAQTALRTSPFYDLRELKVEELDDQRLVIRGMVGSFYHKQLAQEVVLGLAKHRSYRVVNAVEVIDMLSN